jgi:acetoin utilization deacetylase AcuC-like enzyme
VRVLFETHERYLDHDAGRGHPERPERLRAVLAGIERAGLDEAVVRAVPRPATRAELERVHPPIYLDAVERFCAAGGGRLDPDTSVVEGSWEAAVLAAGAGLDAVERLDRGEADAAFCAVRPPGHHATPTRSMGFCIINNVAVAAAALADRGERVLVVDYDAHHGNGTQDAFFDDPRVVYVSFHEYPLYPGTGGLREIGSGDGLGATVNFPLPAGATGDVYLRGLDQVVEPLAEAFAPTWLVLSAGFDGHRADPLTGLGLSSGDFYDLTARLLALVPAGRRLVFLEGGYDLEALADSTAAALAAMTGHELRPEPVTSGGPGREVVGAVAALNQRGVAGDR